MNRIFGSQVILIILTKMPRIRFIGHGSEGKMKLSNHAKDRANEYHVCQEKILSTEYKRFLPENFCGPTGKVAVFVERRRDRNSRIFYIVDYKNDVVVTVEHFLRPGRRVPNVDLVIEENGIVIKGAQK